MRKLMQTNALVLTVFLLAPDSSPAAPVFETGSTLLDSCNAPNLSQHWYCLGYVASIADLHVEREVAIDVPAEPAIVVEDVVLGAADGHHRARHLALGNVGAAHLAHLLVDKPAARRVS